MKAVTVKHLVLSKRKAEIKEADYFICLNEDCEVVYFNQEQQDIFKKNDVKVPIWFKKDADPRYICYCNQVTEEEIVDAVKNKGAKNMKDIVRLTGAMKNANCKLNNPLGKCCGPVIEEIIKKAKHS